MALVTIFIVIRWFKYGKSITIIQNMYPIPKEAYSYWPDKKNCLIETSEYVERLIFARQDLRVWELSALEALDKALGTEIDMSKEDRLRFLYGAGWNMKVTIEVIKAHIEWEKSWPATKLMYPLVTPVLDCGGIYIHGRDHRYRPIIIIQPALLAEFNLQLLIASCYFLLEYIKENMFIPGQIENWVLVIDTQSFDPKDTCIQLINALQSNYPCRTGLIYLITSQKSIPLLKLLSLNAYNKIVQTDSPSTVLNTCNPSQVEEKFGGSALNLIKFWPPCFPSSAYRAENDPIEGFTSNYSSYDEYYSLNCKNSDLSIMKNSQFEDRESFISNSEFKDEIWQKLDVVSGSFSFLHTDLCTRPPEMDEFCGKGKCRGDDVTGASSKLIGKKIEIEHLGIDTGCCVEKFCALM